MALLHRVLVDVCFLLAFRIGNRTKMCFRRVAFCLACFAFRSGRRVPKCSRSFCFQVFILSPGAQIAVELLLHAVLLLFCASCLAYKTHLNCCAEDDSCCRAGAQNALELLRQADFS